MLQDFRHHLYTEFVFGKDAEKNVGEDIKKYGAKKVLIVYGSERIRKDGLLPGIEEDLKKHGIEFVELGGVQPNPRLSLVRKGIEICKKEGVDFLLAVGGGSIIDTSKAIGMGALYDGDVWDLSSDPSKRKGMLPLAVVLTYPAAGSESSKGCVVTNDDKEPYVKASISGSDFARPVISFMNPELTYTLPKYLTACGIADMYVHILERYFSQVNPGSQDYIAEGLLKAIIEFGPKVLAEPNNYEYRAEIMWIGTLAHNDTCGVGRPQDWTTHGLGHEISALYDTAHGATLTIVGPAWMKFVYKDNIARFARFARNVFGINEADDEKAALAGIEANREFYKKIGMPTSFKEGDIPTDQIDYMARHAAELKGGSQGCMKKIGYKEGLEIYKIAAEA